MDPVTIDQTNPYFEIAGPERLGISMGMQLSKVGASTGWTTGDVQETCITGHAPGGNRLFCQHRVQAGATGGDSGSPVFWIRPDSTVYLEGILWGGESGDYIFSSLDGMVADLGTMHFWSVEPAPAFDLSGPGELDPGQYGTWYISNLHNGQSPYTYAWHVDGVLQGATGTSFTTFFDEGPDHFVSASVTDWLGMVGTEVRQVFVTSCPPGEETCD